MRTTAALIALVLAPVLALACEADEGDPCQREAQCVQERCVQVESVAECIEGESPLSPEACEFNENALYVCAERECNAGDDAVGEALAVMSVQYRGLRCEL